MGDSTTNGAELAAQAVSIASVLPCNRIPHAAPFGAVLPAAWAPMELRNIAIIAHVDHGKTTLVDRLLQHAAIGRDMPSGERMLDSGVLERERGITILSKTTSIEHRGVRINIVDTPGHADFGGEVERVLSMVDSVLLLVDAVEGPMPQTRFVTAKAFERGLQPLLVVNKIDRSEARPDEVMDEVFDLFDSLGGTEAQLDFETVYCSATQGRSGLEHDRLESSMSPLLDLLISSTSPPESPDGPFQMQICTLDHSPYIGVIGIGRVHRGSVRPRDTVAVIDRNGNRRPERVLSLHANHGLERHDLQVAEAGDIVCVTGIDGVQVSDTLADPEAPEALPAIDVDPPTVTMSFRVNQSPFAGRDGTHVTSGKLAARLHAEASHNVALSVRGTGDPGRFEVSGRGELHLSVLIETMRREGYELAVSRPEVIYQNRAGACLEPFDTIVADVLQEHQGRIMESLGARLASLQNVVADSRGRVQLTYRVATRALMGYRREFATLTSGTGILTYASAGFDAALEQLDTRRRNGALVSKVSGSAVSYALSNLQNRGRLFVSPGTPLYPGMVVGLHARDNDLAVNPAKEKKLSNVRAAGSDDNLLLNSPLELTLETAIELVSDDELVEVTPRAIRIRKKPGWRPK